jgi:FkbM family methyltransferase
MDMRNSWFRGGVALFQVLLAVFVFASGCTRGEPIPDRTKKLYSQNDEELLIREFFDDRRGGFFLDVGSYHWEELSTTYFLEKHLGWSGIAIDAQAGFAEGYKQFRPKTKFFSYAVTDRSGETIQLYLSGGTSSLDPDWYKYFLKKGQESPAPAAVDVPTITLNDLLEKNGVKRIDFLSMDIEGAEPAALAGFDIEKYKPDLVLIEPTHNTREPILEYFQKHGYQRIDEYLERDKQSWYFRRTTGR